MSSSSSSSPVESGSVTHQLSELGVARISFFHPSSNSLPRALLTAIAERIQTVSALPTCKVIILQSDGTGPFCAGASFDELLKIKTEAEGERFFSGFAEVMLALISAPQFTIARIHGKAAGGGVGLACATDVTLATTAAAARLSELAIGIGPFTIGPVVERRIGVAAFTEMALTAEWKDAAWCHKHSLFSEVFSDTQALDARLEELSRRVAAYPASALAAVKRITTATPKTADQDWAALLPALLAERVTTVSRLVVSDEAQALIRAAKR